MKRFLLGLVWLVGCGGGGSDSDPIGGGGDVTLGELCLSLAEAMCDKLTECSPPAPANCVATFSAACCPSSVNCNTEIPDSEGRLDDCVDAFEDLSCTDAEEGVSPDECRP